ncbi:MAG: RNase adapter RapZ [Deltaproteobacteria bacterium]|nr:RNase adapter RapZ [Deltaproteobacteria bacterium]
MKLVIVTGLSGAGKTVVLHSLEDLGFFAVDNLPVPLTDGFVKLMDEKGHFDKVAIAIDIRNADFLDHWSEVKETLNKKNHTVEILFLEADNEILLNRFKASRRPHPLGGDTLISTIENEINLLNTLRDDVSTVIDTSDLTVHELRSKIFGIFSNYEKPRLMIKLMSFGFSRGVPMESDILLDVRFLPNPYFVSELREYTGVDHKIQTYLENKDEFREFYSRFEDFLKYLIPLYEKEGKSYLTCSIGCTGGKHRSVYIVEKSALTLRKLGYKITVQHRDIRTY